MTDRFCVNASLDSLLKAIYKAATFELKSQMIESDFDDCESIQQCRNRFNDEGSDRTELNLVEFDDLIKLLDV